MDQATQHLQDEVRLYIRVFLFVAALTLIAVGFRYINFSPKVYIILQIALAIIRGGLIAWYLMHLMKERTVVKPVLILAAVFFISLLLLPFCNFRNHITGAQDTGAALQQTEPEHEHVH